MAIEIIETTCTVQSTSIVCQYIGILDDKLKVRAGLRVKIIENKIQSAGKQVSKKR